MNLIFKKLMWFRGRNGTFRATGLNMNKFDTMDNSKCIEISVINSKGQTGSCWLEIPIEDIDKFIKILQNLKDG